MGNFEDIYNHLTNISVLIESSKKYYNTITTPTIITTILMIFSVIGGIDYIMGKKHGYGLKYEAAFKMLPDLAIAMIGITCLVPVIRILLEPFITPIFKLLGADPSIFAGSLLACDMGGYPLAIAMAGNEKKSIGLFSGLILGSMLGVSFSFNIPLGMAIIPKKYHFHYAYGTLLGMTTIPFGCIVGGYSMNLTPNKMLTKEIFFNTLPVLLISLIISITLYFYPQKTLNIFLKFSKIIDFLKIFGAFIAFFQYFTKIQLPLFNTMILPEYNDGIIPLTESLLVIGIICVMLTGTLPLVYFIITYFGNTLSKIGKYIKLNSQDSTGLISILASALPFWEMFDKLGEHGMIIVSGFNVGASYVFGDHLGYIGGVAPDMILPVIIAKLTQGFLALIVGYFVSDFFVIKANEQMKLFLKHEEEEEENNEVVNIQPKEI